MPNYNKKTIAKLQCNKKIISKIIDNQRYIYSSLNALRYFIKGVWVRNSTKFNNKRKELLII